MSRWSMTYYNARGKASERSNLFALIIDDREVARVRGMKRLAVLCNDAALLAQWRGGNVRVQGVRDPRGLRAYPFVRWFGRQ